MKNALFALVLVACVNSNLDPVTPNPPVINDSDLCGLACERLSQLGCEEGGPVSVGIPCNSDSECSDGEQCMNRLCHDSCEHFCLVTQAAGVWLDPNCVSHINSCSEVNTCPTTDRND